MSKQRTSDSAGVASGRHHIVGVCAAKRFARFLIALYRLDLLFPAPLFQHRAKRVFQRLAFAHLVFDRRRSRIRHIDTDERTFAADELPHVLVAKRRFPREAVTGEVACPMDHIAASDLLDGRVWTRRREGRLLSERRSEPYTSCGTGLDVIEKVLITHVEFSGLIVFLRTDLANQCVRRRCLDDPDVIARAWGHPAPPIMDGKRMERCNRGK